MQTLEMPGLLGLLRRPDPHARLLAWRDTPSEALTFAERLTQGAARHRVAVSGTGTGWEIHLGPECAAGICQPCDAVRAAQTEQADQLVGD